MTRSELKRLFVERLEQNKAPVATLLHIRGDVPNTRVDSVVPESMPDKTQAMIFEAVKVLNWLDMFRRYSSPSGKLFDLRRFAREWLMVTKICEELFRELYERYDALLDQTAPRWSREVLENIAESRMLDRLAAEQCIQEGSPDAFMLSPKMLKVYERHVNFVLDALLGRDRASCYRELVLWDLGKLDSVFEVERATRRPIAAAAC